MKSFCWGSSALIVYLRNSQVLDWWETFFRTGSLIFGGGQVGCWRFWGLAHHLCCCRHKEICPIRNAATPLLALHHNDLCQPDDRKVRRAT